MTEATQRIETVADAAGYLVDGLGLVSDNLGVVIGAWVAWKGLGLVSYIANWLCVLPSRVPYGWQSTRKKV